MEYYITQFRGTDIVCKNSDIDILLDIDCNLQYNLPILKIDKLRDTQKDDRSFVFSRQDEISTLEEEFSEEHQQTFETSSISTSGDEFSEDESKTSMSHSSLDQQIEKDVSYTITESNDSDSSSSEMFNAMPSEDETTVTKQKPKAKNNCCLYCNKLVQKLPRHLEAVHRNEIDVRKFSSLPKGAADRKQIIDILRKKGNYQYFKTHSEENTEDFIACRRPRKNSRKDAGNYVCCPNCLGFYTKAWMYRHNRKCDSANYVKGQRTIMVAGRRVLSRISTVACEVLKSEVYPPMRDDDVTDAVRYDELLIKFGNHLCQKYRSKHLLYHIRQQLRTLGRLLLEVKKIDANIHNFASLYSANKYDLVKQAVNRVAGLDETTNIYRAPSLAFSLGTILKKVGKLFVIECIKANDLVSKADAESFLNILEVDYGASVNKTVADNQQMHKRRGENVNLPNKSDIKLLVDFLDLNAQTACAKIEKKFKYKYWISLAQYTLISIQVFNRRRSGETERILIEDFKTYRTIDESTDADTYEMLSLGERLAARKYVRFVVRGKLGRSVAILLDKKTLHYCEIILKHRSQANVPDDNPYLFGVPNNNARTKHLRACDLLRKYSEDCKASRPETLRGTNLRKHFATVLQAFDLTEADVTQLSNFMGHSVDIHKNHYQLPAAAIDMGRISNLLEVVRKGSTDKTRENVRSRRTSNEMDTDDADPSINVSFSNAVPDSVFTYTENEPINDVEDNFNENVPANSESDLDDVVSKSKSENDDFNKNLSSNSESDDDDVSFDEITIVSVPDKNLLPDSVGDNVTDSDSSNDINLKAVPGPSGIARRSNLTSNELHANKEKVSWLTSSDSDSLDIVSGSNRRRIKRTWCTPEKDAARTHLRTFIQQQKIPPVKTCESIVKSDTALERRTAMQLRLWVSNEINRQLSEGSRVRKSWTTPEKKIAREVFFTEISAGKFPTAQKCQEVITQHCEFKGRTVAQIKSWIQSQHRRTNY